MQWLSYVDVPGIPRIAQMSTSLPRSRMANQGQPDATIEEATQTWLVELDQIQIGRWPVKEHLTRLSKTPTCIGGRLDHSGPNYGEDNDYVLGKPEA